MATRYDHYKTIDYSLKDRVLTLTFNNPDKLNCMTEKREEELAQFFHDGALDEDFDVAVITGSGRAFAAGGDIENWMLPNTQDPGRVKSDLSKRFVFNIIDFPKPVIAKVNGHAVGLGATLALFCDVIFAAEHAKIADPHVLLGLSAGDGGAIIWPQLVGYVRAKEYLMVGEYIPAPKAAEMGLINYSVPADQLDARVDEYVQRLLKGAQVAIRATKRTINLGLKQVASHVMDASIAYEHLTVYTEDHAEAVHAFLEKRPPVFKGK
jgi:enoyl-CoA hydratase